MDFKNKLIDFRETTFYKGANATFGKIPVLLELHLDIPESFQLKIELSAGIDKMYVVGDMERFLNAFQNGQIYYFSKNFIFEPEKMYFQKQDRKLLEILCDLNMRQPKSTSTKEIILKEEECQGLLDYIWDDLKEIRRHKSDKIQFKDDIKLEMNLKKSGQANRMSVDYSEYGDFEPLTINFKYIYFKDKSLIVRLPEEKQELMRNLYPAKNKENLVWIQIEASEMRLFQKNFLEQYGDKLNISIDKKVKEEMILNQLLIKVYIDLSDKGIVSKMEFCYGDKVVNPLDDSGVDKSIRGVDCENTALNLMKTYGFREYGRLFLLDDVEKIMFLLTDQLTELKKIAEVYYSVDFKKLYVKHLDSFCLSLSEDESIIHMNINLENVSDEELAELLDAIKAGKKYYRLKNGSIVNLASVESSKLVDFINSMDISKDNIQGGIFEIPLNRCMYIENYLEEKKVDNFTLDPELGYLMKKIGSPDEIEVSLNENLKKTLREYQLTGVKWLKTMAAYSFGGLLADDMGLGKTLQVLAFLAGEKNSVAPSIVVAPTSVLYNWKMEAEKYTPELKVILITGNKEQRKLLLGESGVYNLIITSYGALKNDIESYQSMGFSYIFLDEAQNIKNPKTLNASSVKSLTGKCAFALTGTPIENRLAELWSIFDFIMPGLLFDRTRFMRTFEEPIIKNKDPEKMEELSRIIKPFLLRRLKKDVLTELPDKMETNYYSEMKEEQKKLYAAFYKDCKNELIPMIEESGMTKNQTAIFTALTRLRQICAHPKTFLDDYNGGSGKMEAALKIIHSFIASGHSILLFSQFTKMLKIIRDELEKTKVNWYYLDGTMKSEERMVEIDNFNHDKEAVFLISLKAGGTGLNLTKADVVIHFDPWWNPATENQASDRAHRMGQKNVVQVYNLLTEGTIEEKMTEMKERKKDLLEELIKPGEMFFSQLSGSEIRELFNL